MYKEMAKAKRMHVAVGLPKDKVGNKIYGDGMSIFRVGAIHEYGVTFSSGGGLVSIPMRSFLRMPFNTKKTELQKYIAKQFENVSEGKTKAVTALGRVGIFAENISKGAFTTKGYGQWPDLKQSTINAKGSSQVLIDTGILRGSITSVVRDGK